MQGHKEYAMMMPDDETYVSFVKANWKGLEQAFLTEDQSQKIDFKWNSIKNDYSTTKVNTFKLSMVRPTDDFDIEQLIQMDADFVYLENGHKNYADVVNMCKQSGYTLNMSNGIRVLSKTGYFKWEAHDKDPHIKSFLVSNNEQQFLLCLCDPDVTVEIEQLRKICESQNDVPILCLHAKQSGGIFDDKALFLNFETAGAQVSDKKLTVSVLKNKNTEAQPPLLDAYLTTIAAQEVCGFKLMVLGKIPAASASPEELTEARKKLAELQTKNKELEEQISKGRSQFRNEIEQLKTVNDRQTTQLANLEEDLGTKKAALDKHIEMYTDLESKYKIMKKKLKREKDLTEEKEVELLSLQKELDHQKK